jgi:hypothetical protein
MASTIPNSTKPHSTIKTPPSLTGSAGRAYAKTIAGFAITSRQLYAVLATCVVGIPIWRKSKTIPKFLSATDQHSERRFNCRAAEVVNVDVVAHRCLNADLVLLPITLVCYCEAYIAPVSERGCLS